MLSTTVEYGMPYGRPYMAPAPRSPVPVPARAGASSVLSRMTISRAVVLMRSNSIRIELRGDIRSCSRCNSALVIVSVRVGL
eukprot:SAG22_NODE_162_length_16848_cov_16.978267_10_plen_82_part_00